jgi:hypothetical protein
MWNHAKDLNPGDWMCIQIRSRIQNNPQRGSDLLLCMAIVQGAIVDYCYIVGYGFIVKG